MSNYDPFSAKTANSLVQIAISKYTKAGNAAYTAALYSIAAAIQYGNCDGLNALSKGIETIRPRIKAMLFALNKTEIGDQNALEGSGAMIFSYKKDEGFRVKSDRLAQRRYFVPFNEKAEFVGGDAERDRVLETLRQIWDTANAKEAETADKPVKSSKEFLLSTLKRIKSNLANNYTKSDPLAAEWYETVKKGIERLEKVA